MNSKNTNYYLCLDVGNTDICGYVINNQISIHTFRYSSKNLFSSDQFGLFLSSVFHEFKIHKTAIAKVLICSVVDHLENILNETIITYLQLTPTYFRASSQNFIQIKTNNPTTIGADIVAGCIGAQSIYPQENLLVCDFGTATTIALVNKQHELLAYLILPGLNLMNQSLSLNTSKLRTIAFTHINSLMGYDTISAIQNGIVLSQIALIQHLKTSVACQYSLDNGPKVIATGGFSQYLQAQSNIFDKVSNELIALGLMQHLQINA